VKRSEQTPILYSCVRSRGLRVSWTAAELGIALKYEMLPFPPRARATEFLDINPLGTVPMLEHAGHRMTESSAICQYLVTLAETNSLGVSPGEADYAMFLDFMHYADATITFPQTVYMRYALFEKDKGFESVAEDYARWYAARLVKAAQHLERRSYLCADRFTIADIAVSYALYLSTLNGLDHLVPQSLQAYRDRMISRPGFAIALKNEQQAQAV
jgi:glutathione S-transferase